MSNMKSLVHVRIVANGLEGLQRVERREEKQFDARRIRGSKRKVDSGG